MYMTKQIYEYVIKSYLFGSGVFSVIYLVTAESLNTCNHDDLVSMKTLSTIRTPELASKDPYPVAPAY